MEDLTFGEQVKIILGRKGMTIKQLAEQIEVQTGKKMSRQNLTQRLGRDNFQEQDMRMIAEILECPFRLSILGGEAQAQPIPKNKIPESRITVSDPEKVLHPEKQPEPAEVQTEYVREERQAEETVHYQPEEQKAEPADTAEQQETVQQNIAAGEETAPGTSAEQHGGAEETLEADERDMTIGELYDIHKELSEIEESIKAGEPVEKAKEELSRKKKSRFSPGNIFLRRKHTEEPAQNREEKETEKKAENSPAAAEEPVRQTNAEETAGSAAGEEKTDSVEKAEDFEPVISREDSDEDTVVGDVNPYTGREYQSNSVRMHPTRIGYVQVYDRTIHKWTDMTEWAFLGYQERKKTLLGNAYEPPIYLD